MDVDPREPGVAAREALRERGAVAERRGVAPSPAAAWSGRAAGSRAARATSPGKRARERALVERGGDRGGGDAAVRAARRATALRNAASARPCAAGREAQLDVGTRRRADVGGALGMRDHGLERLSPPSASAASQPVTPSRMASR